MEHTNDAESRAGVSCFEKQVKNYCTHLAQVLVEKNKSYGNSHAKVNEILNVLSPAGCKGCTDTEKNSNDNLVYTIRILDKLCRLVSCGDSDSEDQWLDIAGYAVLAGLQQNKRTPTIMENRAVK